MTATDIFEAGGLGKAAPNTLGTLPAIKSEDISNAVLYLLSTPYYVNITELTIKVYMKSFNPEN